MRGQPLPPPGQPRPGVNGLPLPASRPFPATGPMTNGGPPSFSSGLHVNGISQPPNQLFPQQPIAGPQQTAIGPQGSTGGGTPFPSPTMANSPHNPGQPPMNIGQSPHLNSRMPPPPPNGIHQGPGQIPGYTMNRPPSRTASPGQMGGMIHCNLGGRYRFDLICFFWKEETISTSVMGDAGRLYVSADVVPVYRSLLPLSTIITPNWFEVETLTGISLTDLHSLRHALTKLHKDFGVPNVAISSIPLTQWLSKTLPYAIRPPAVSESEHLLCITSSVSNENSPSDSHAQCVPLLPGYFSSVGDLFSSLVLAHYNPSLESSLPGTSTIPDIFTFEYSERLPEEERLITDDEKDAVEPIRKVQRMRGRELRLVQSIDIIRSDFGDATRRLEHWSGFWERL
ncbi:Ribokinase-like protein [Lentinula novae-zelandiae]|nr:Ribokinase-like protein [Lentinula novae-zelandiae]